MEDWQIVLVAVAALGIVGGGLTAALRIGKWVGAVNTDRISFKDFMNEIRVDIKEILKRLPPATVGSESPIQLTDLGRTISQSLGVSDWAAEQALLLVEDARGKQEYEVHDLSLEHVQKRFAEDSQLNAHMRDDAYQHGIDVEKVQDVYAVELRDELLRRIGGEDSMSDEKGGSR